MHSSRKTDYVYCKFLNPMACEAFNHFDLKALWTLAFL